MPNQKLELTWIGKENKPRLEPRILLENPQYSYHAPHHVTQDDIFDNILIHGDNLLALKALEEEYAGQVKCIYIDPPYNTGNAFDHYDDGVEHSIWLGLMRDRIEALYKLLSNDGSIWINLDDSEAHYCKVICDEIFGRGHFIANVIWEKADSPRMDAEFFSVRHDHILVYAKDRSYLKFNRLKEIPKHYNRVDKDGRKYYTKPLRAMGGQGDSREARPTLFYPLISPDGSEIFPIRQDGSDGAWRWRKEKVEEESFRIEWVNGRNGWTPYYKIYADETKGRPPETIFPNSQVGSNRTSKAEVKKIFHDVKAFKTPKPEGLISHILTISTNPGDLVLDSFLGSGTTAAVAHKMGRRWIGIELGDHCFTHCVPRLKQVIDGTDQGGISKAVNWKGGGGYRYYDLAPSLLEKDRWGNWIINREYNPEMLAKAICKLEGFQYKPSDSIYWQHGTSSETDFIYITTQNLSFEQLQALSEEVGTKQTLLVMCLAFRCKEDQFENLTIRKIPPAVLSRCEWGKDDYSLKVENLPGNPDPIVKQMTLFEEGGDE